MEVSVPVWTFSCAFCEAENVRCKRAGYKKGYLLRGGLFQTCGLGDVEPDGYLFDLK